VPEVNVVYLRGVDHRYIDVSSRSHRFSSLVTNIKHMTMIRDDYENKCCYSHI